jgi:hypothetical protein
MPLLAVNLSDTLADQIKPLVEKGLYKSFETFLEIAAFNQLALERGASPAEIVEKGHRRVRHAEGSDNGAERSMKMKAKPEPEKTKSSPRQAQRPLARVVVEEVAVTEEDYAAAFKRLAANGVKLDTLVVTHPDQDHLSHERVFGQVNRLLPLKLACRWLAVSAATEGKWPKYDAISDRLGDDAGIVGSLLEKWDVDNDRKRDEQLATGLPRKGNSASRDRFLTQFLGRITRGGEVYPGAVCQYQLARFEDSAVMLTEQGLAFSNLENPVIDKKDSKTTATLAPAESEFLARQVLRWVPAERDDMRLVFQAVAAGKVTPADLSAAVRSRFPAEWSDSVFSTHLSGLIARLSDLRLMKRVWQGRNVNYELGDRTQVKEFIGAKAQEQR